MRIWFTIFVCCPAPAPPCLTITLPIACQHGFRASTTSASPPIIIDSRASCAPTSPPETGASTLATPLAFAASWISTANDGSLVVMSTSTLPASQPARAPSGPSTTSRTSRGKPTMLKITSLRSATDFGVSAQVAPCSRTESAVSRVRVYTVAEKPRSMRWAHMLRPMTPRPIHPMRVLPGSTVMVETRVVESGHGSVHGICVCTG